MTCGIAIRKSVLPIAKPNVSPNSPRYFKRYRATRRNGFSTASATAPPSARAAAACPRIPFPIRVITYTGNPTMPPRRAAFSIHNHAEPKEPAHYCVGPLSDVLINWTHVRPRLSCLHLGRYPQSRRSLGMCDLRPRVAPGSRGKGQNRQRCSRQPAGRMRRRRVDQGSQITGFIAGAQGRHQDQTHSTRCRGPRDRLQNRRHLYGPQSLFREKGVGPQL